MKRITIILLLMFLVGQMNAQYLVVGNSSSGGNNISFQDTILSSIAYGYCSSFDYYFELDQNSIADIDFYLECYMGGSANINKIYLTSLNGFSIHIDTGYIEHFQFMDSVGQVHDTTRKIPVVKKYNLGDTIFSNRVFLDTEGKLLEYDHWHPIAYPSLLCTSSNIDLFLQDTSYIAFEKSNGDLYYFKIYVPSRSTLELLYAKTSAQINNISGNIVSGNIIFPNPAKEIISFRQAFDLIQIFNAQGMLLVEENLLATQNTFDISHLKSGFYIVKLKMGNNIYASKLIKL